MDAMEAIFSRRSIRAYTSRPVADDLITNLLRAAMSAPSAGNQQPWHFVVITERLLLDQIPSIHPHAGMLKQAQAAILVCGDPDLEKHRGYWVQDCAAATENLLVAAAAQGIGAVWTGVYPREDRVAGLRKLLNIPEHAVPFSLIPLGYAAVQPGKADRFNASRIHRERW